MRIVQVQATLPTITGDFDIASGTGTPIGVILQVSSSVTSGTPVRGSMLGYGISDGTTHLAGSAFSQDTSVASSDTGGRASATMLDICLPTGTGADAAATFVAWIAGGVRINFSNAPATALICNATFFYADVASESVAVRSLTTANSIGGFATITDLSAKPSAFISFTGGLGTTFNNARIIRGFACDNNGTTQQGGASYFEADASDPTACTQEVSETFFYSIVGGARYDVLATGPATGWLSNGVSVRTNVAGTATPLHLFIITTPFRVWVGSPSIGTNATGDKDVTTPGFPAGIVAAIGTKLGAFDTTASDTTAGLISFGIGNLRGLSQQLGAFQSQDNLAAGAQVTRSVVESGAVVRVVDNDGTDDWKAALIRGNSDGFRINVSDASAADRKVVFLVLGFSLVVSEVVHISDGHVTIQNKFLSTTEVVDIIDSPVLKFTAFILTVNETEQIIEATNAVLNHIRSFTEIENIVEASNAILGNFLSVNETENIVDSPVLVSGQFLVVNETEDIIETAVFPVGMLMIVVNETEDVIDSPVLAVTAWRIVANEEVDISELLLKTGTITLVATETVQISETVRVLAGERLVVSDVVEISDGFVRGTVVAMKGTRRQALLEAGAEIGTVMQDAPAKGGLL